MSRRRIITSRTSSSVIGSVIHDTPVDEHVEPLGELPQFRLYDLDGKGIATALLGAALDLLRGRGAEIAEGYPVKPARDGAPTPPALARTDPRRLFAACGFEVVGNPDGGKERVRKLLA